MYKLHSPELNTSRFMSLPRRNLFVTSTNGTFSVWDIRDTREELLCRGKHNKHLLDVEGESLIISYHKSASITQR